MKIFIIVIISIIVDYLLGCAVLAYIDDSERRLFKWASSNSLLYSFVVMFWFITVFFWYKNKNNGS